MFSDRGDGAHRPRRRRAGWHRFAVGLALLAALVAIGAMGALVLQSSGALGQVEAAVDAARPWLVGAQLLATAAVWAAWPRIVPWLATRRWIGPAAVAPLLRARHRLAAAVLLIQATVGLGLPFSLFGAS